jgi:type IV secretory pathway VirB10-like protein
MSHQTCLSPLRLFAGAALLFAAGLAQAQYVWINAKGVREYSDRPPPPSTPAANILKRPQSAALVSEPPVTAAPAATAAPAKQAPPSLAARDADFRKRQQERAKEEQKAADEAQRKESLAENCASALQHKAMLESGIRVADTAANGERTFLSDQERAARLAKTRRILEGCR